METAAKPPRASKHVDVRAFVAGTGVSTALIAAAVLAFVAIAAFVAFEGNPVASGDSPESTLTLPSGAPQAAAAAAGTTAESVAAEPATPSAGALAEIAAALPGAGAGGPGASSGPGDTIVDIPGGGGGTGPGDGPGSEAPAPPGSQPGPLQSTVGAVDDTAGGVDLDLPLGEVTADVTKPLDDFVGGTLNDVGNGIGAGNLGDKTNNVVGGLLD